jgi:transcriptional regulator with XRE-family HTH domain
MNYRKDLTIEMKKTIHHPVYQRAISGLRDERIKRGLTQQRVATRMGRSHQWIHKIESLELRLDVLDFVRFCIATRINRPGRVVEQMAADLSDEA